MPDELKNVGEEYQRLSKEGFYGYLPVWRVNKGCGRCRDDRLLQTDV
jgi:hypothetical protein